MMSGSVRFGVHARLWVPRWSRADLDLIDHAAGLGFSAFEIPLVNLSEVDAAAIRRRAEAAGIQVVGTIALTGDRALATPDATVRARTIDDLKAAAERVSEMGGRLFGGMLYAGPGRLSGRGPTAEELQWLRDGLGEVARAALACGVTLALEPVNRYETHLLNTAAQAQAIVDDLGASNVGLLLDTYHMNIEERGVAGTLRRHAHSLRHLHLNESDRGTLGGGNVDWPGLFAALREVGYAGIGSIETFGATSPELPTVTSVWRPLFASPDQLAQESLAFLQRQVEPVRAGQRLPSASRGRDPLTTPESSLPRGARIPVEIVEDNDALIARFADDILREFTSAREAGRRPVVFIVPVGPVGQYDRVADRCNREGISLQDLVLINMDEYLAPEGGGLIGLDDPLSFRRHMRDHFYDRLDPVLAPPPDHRLCPDPGDPAAIGRAIARFGGCDVCFGGVGITGHVAFNDPPEPGEEISLAAFRALATRVVRLSRETRLINSVTAARGNVDRIPAEAVTVGMQEILASRKVRLYLNRPWQSAIVRKMLHGPVTPRVPASLLQEHPDTRVVIAAHVAQLPQPELQ